MREARLAFLVRARQRHPSLDAEQLALALDASLLSGALGVDDATACAHQVHGPGPDRDLGAEAVAVHDLAVEQIGDGSEPDMRVWAHVHAGADEELGRAHLIPEDE